MRRPVTCQTGSRRIPVAQAQTQVRSCGICGAQSSTLPFSTQRLTHLGLDCSGHVKCALRSHEPGPEPVLTKVKVKVILRLTVCQSVRLGVEPTLGLVTRCCFPLEGMYLKICCPVFCWAPSLTRGRVCHLSVQVSSRLSS
jgi:hypothetical protein